MIRHSICVFFAFLFGALTVFGESTEQLYPDLHQMKVGDPVEIDLSVLITFLENDNALAWNKNGYVELHGIFGNKFLRTKQILTVRVEGVIKLLGPTPVIEVDRIEELDNRGVEPEIMEAPHALGHQPEQVFRGRFQGKVEHVLDLDYSNYVRINVGGNLVTYQIRVLEEDMERRVVTGQQISFSGYVWKPRNSYKARDPDVLVVTKDPLDYDILEKSKENRGVKFDPGILLEDGQVYYFPQMIHRGGGVKARSVLFMERTGKFTVQVDTDHTSFQLQTLIKGLPFDLFGRAKQIAPNSYQIVPLRIVGRGFRQSHEEILTVNKTSLQAGIPIGRIVQIKSATVVVIKPWKNGSIHMELALEDQKENALPLRILQAQFALNGSDIAPGDKINLPGKYLGEIEGDYLIRATGEAEKLVLPSNLGRTLLLWFSGTLLVGLLALVWIYSLKRSVRERTSELSASESRLRTSEANLRAVYSSVPEAFLATTSEGTVFSTNSHFNEWFTDTDLLGATEAIATQLIGQRFVGCEDAWMQFVASKPEQRAKGIELEAELSDLGRRVMGMRVLPIELEDASEGRLWVFRDISEQKQMEKTLVQSSKLEAIGRLTGGIAHDFNNLLTAVTGNLSLLDMELEDAELREYVHNANTGAIRASELVKQLLDYAKQTRLELRVCSINDILIDLHDLLRHGMNSRYVFEFDLAHDLLQAEVDVLKIEQVLMNLLINATDAMPDGGQIKVVTRNMDVVDGDGLPPVQILVEDTGTGMSEELLRNIFEPFFTTKGDRGTGLGLSTSLGIIEQHGGRLSCESELGVGTQFRILLPSCEAAPASESLEEVEKLNEDRAMLAPGFSPKVLVVDDEPTVRLFLRSALQRYSCEVVCFPNGKEAVEYFSENKQNVDLVICDNSMPVMDGVLTYASIREACSSTPFFVVSGYLIDLENYASVANGQAPDGFLQKPLSVKPLKSMLQGTFS